LDLSTQYACVVFICLALLFMLSDFQSVTARFVFFRLFETSHHRHSNTFLGWSAWAGIIGATWAAGFVIAEIIPFFTDMLSVMSSLFGAQPSVACVPD
jgi:hypothetical protein